MIDLGKVDEGIQVFKLGDQEIPVDIYQACKAVMDIKQRHDQFNEGFWLNDIVELLVSYGFNKCSTSTAMKFVKQISILAEELKKNIE